MKVPSTVEEYCVKTTLSPRGESSIDMDDFFDEEDIDCGEDDQDEDEVTEAEHDTE